MTPLRRLLTRHLLGIQLPLVGILLGLVWWGSRSLLLGQAQRDGEARLRIAVQALDQRLTSVERAGAFLSTYWEQGRLPFGDPEQNAGLLMPWLFNQDAFRLLNLLDEQGRSLLLMSDHDEWRAREIQLGAPDHLLLRWRKAGPRGIESMAEPARELRGYDPRQRAWYQQARLLDAPCWSVPYRLGPPESRLVMTWLVPLRKPGLPLEGALGLDIVAEDLQGLLELLRPTSGSRLWLLDQDAQVLSSAHGTQAEVPVPAAGDQAKLGDLRYRVLRSAVPRHAGSHWRMVLAIPERDLLAPVQGRLMGITAAAFVLLMLPILWGLWVGSRLSREVQALAEAADQLGAGEMPELPAHDVAEFRSLGQNLRSAHAQILERNRLQQQTQHSQRLETLGTLAGGIAHDVNNHLSAILGQIHLVRETLPEGHASSLRLAQAEAAANNCARTTRTLLAFSRQGNPDLLPMDLNDLLTTMADLLNHLLGGLIRVTLDLDPHPMRIQGDRLQLEQVVMNLAVNARDAMPEGGQLVFRTRAAPEDAVTFTVTDTGSGIPPETIGHIFEPFFTTKPVGVGTGLGLSMVHGIVQTHGGRIDVESHPGRGTTFTLILPFDHSGPIAPTLARAATGTRHPLKGWNILVAEDEAYLLETLVDALTDAGADLIGVPDGLTAWEAFKVQAFDCVLSDQRMPGCTGMELYRRIRTTGIDTPFILASGQDLEPFRQELGADPKARLLSKPFTISGLVQLMEAFPLPSATS